MLKNPLPMLVWGIIVGAGLFIGALPLFVGEFQEERDTILAKYSNAPVENYAPYLDSTLQLQSEPPIETQKMYAELDTAMQAVLPP